MDKVEKRLSFYVVENLRHQQDGTGGFKIDRYDELQDAIDAFNALPSEYTSAIGGSMTGGKFGVGEIDFVHRKNGESVLVGDVLNAQRWDVPEVREALDELTRQLKIEFESDLRIFGDKTVLLPLRKLEQQTLNTVYMDKYLRPEEGAEREVARRYGDLSMYSKDSHIRSMHLLTAINEVFTDIHGWLNAEDFLKRLYSIDEYSSPERLKALSFNVNYVDLNGREGQIDISPYQLYLLKQQTIERSAKHVPIDMQIDNANKIRNEQMGKKSKDKNKDKVVDSEIDI